MRLYHFTGASHVAGIQRDGLRLGIVPQTGDWHLTGLQWLTDDPSWKQAWSAAPLPCGDGTVCDRTAVRFEVVIPKPARRFLSRWTDIGPSLTDAEMYARLNLEADGASHWWLYGGTVKPGWLRAMVYRP